MFSKGELFCTWYKIATPRLVLLKTSGFKGATPEKKKKNMGKKFL